MNKIWIIIQREYITRVKRKSFVITTLLAPLGFFALISGSVLISTYSQGRTDIAVIDESGLFKDITLPDAEDQTVYFHKVDENYEKLAALLPKEKKEKSKYQGIIYIPQNFDVLKPNKIQIAYRFTERPGIAKKQFINKRIGEAVENLHMKLLKIDEETQQQMREKAEVNFSSLDNLKEKTGYAEAAGLAGMVMAFAIYISLFFYGTMIMKGVMEEKTSRIVEVLTSSVKPFQLLMGKIVGIGGVGLTQYILWMVLTAFVYLFSIVLYGPQLISAAGSMNSAGAGSIDPDSFQNIWNNLSELPFLQISIFFPLYFIGGFLLYGALFAAIGAAMGEDGDQQSLMVPITVPLIISSFIAINVINNPDSALGFWGSIIPLTSPVVMSALLPFRPVWWQIALSLALLAGGFVLTTYIAAKIYRVAILMYGKKITLKEMGRWIFSRQ